MAYIEMRVAPIKKGSRGKVSFEQEFSLFAIEESPWVIVPRGVSSISVTLTVKDGGKGKVQTTTDLVSIVKSGMGINAIDWNLGEVSADSQDSCTPVTAIRLVQTFAGKTKLTMRA